MADSALQRKNMVESQVRPSDVTDRRITSAMRDIPRERFVPSELATLAYMDTVITVAPGRGLMAPRDFARLVQLADVQDGDSVLIVGSTLGYSAAVLSRLASRVTALESDPNLCRNAQETLKSLGISNVEIVCGPLADGWRDAAPYHVIIIEGALDALPQPLMDQLAKGGRLVMVRTDEGVGHALIAIHNGATTAQRIAFEASAPRLQGFEQPARAFAF